MNQPRRRLHYGALLIHSEEWLLASFLATKLNSATDRNRNWMLQGDGEVPCDLVYHDEQ